MKKILSIFSLLILFAACSSEKKENKDLTKLKEHRDSLKTVYADLSKHIKAIDKKIMELDTTIRNQNTLVSSLIMTPQTFEHYFEVQGTVEADNSVLLNAEMGGTITKIFVKEGQRVSAGQTLVSLDSEGVDANIQEIQSALDLAKITFEKQKRLWDQKIGTEMQYLQAKNQKESLEARLKSIKSQQGKSVIRAPFSGTIDEVFAKNGQLAGPQMPLIRLVNLSKVQLVANVPENHLASIKKGNIVKVEFPSLKKTVDAKINSVGSFINPANRTFKVVIDLPSNQYYKPNLFAMVNIRDLLIADALTLPSSLIQQDRAGNDFVYVLKEDIAYKTIIETGIAYRDKTLVLKGLEANQEIINEGARSVRNQEEVEVVR